MTYSYDFETNHNCNRNYNRNYRIDLRYVGISDVSNSVSEECDREYSWAT